MQVTLSARADFTDPPHGFRRAAAFYTRIVDGGEDSDLTGAPHFAPPMFRAQDLTEAYLKLLADNCGARAVVIQLVPSGLPDGSLGEDTVDFKKVSFHRPENGTTAYSHTAKIYPGGRAVSDDEAVGFATANAKSFGLDPTTLTMKLTTDVRHAPRTQRLDPESNELVDLPVRELKIGGEVDALSQPEIL